MGRREQFTVGELTVTSLVRDASGNSNKAFGTSVPADGSSGYAIGAEFFLTNAALGAVPQWINLGTTTSSKFRPFGPQLGWGIMLAGNKAFDNGDTSLTPAIGSIHEEWDVGFAGYSASDDNDQLLSTKITDLTLTITTSADPLVAHAANFGVIRQGCLAAFDIVFAGTRTTVGGAAAEAITLTGALATDLGFAVYSATNDTDTINKVVMTANTMTITMSADPSTAHGHHYMVLRPRGLGKPSHYIAYAGVHTTVGGAAAEPITVTGALATDIPIVWWDTTDDTDTILKSVMTANTLTVTGSADPGATHKIGYMILRAY